MRKLYQSGWMLLLFAIGFTGVAQAQLQIEIMVKSVYVDYGADDGDSYGGRFRFYYNNPADNCGPLLHPFCNNSDRRCIQLPRAHVWSGDIWTPLNIFTLPAGTTTFTLFMRSHHERQKDCTSRSSEECTVEDLGCGRPDRHELLTSMPVNLAGIQPGAWMPLGTMTNQDNTTAQATLLIRYTVPTPVLPKPQPVDTRTTFCAQEVVELATNVSPNNTGLTYNWQYALQTEDYQIWNPDKDPRNFEHPSYGCGHWEEDPFSPDGQYWMSGWDCHLPDLITVQNWKTLPVTNPNTDRFARFTPAQALFSNAITERTNVYFRTQAVSTENRTSSWSPTATYTILPAPPGLDEAKLDIRRSCPFPNNGRVVIGHEAISTPFTQVRWLLKNGHYNSGNCSVVFNGDGTISSTCGEIENQSPGLVNVPKSAADAPIVIDNLPKGQYTLWLINPGETSGSCYTPVNITIDEYPPLTLTTLSTNHVTCFGASDGSLKLEAGGGDATGGYQFKLMAKDHPALSFDFTTISGNVFERTGLPADEYTVTMKNACTPEKTVTIVLTEPVKVLGAAVFNQPGCYDPANGGVVVNVSQGMGNYTYQLWQGTSLLKEITAVSATQQVFDKLAAGLYTVKILDADRTGCAGWDSTMELIAPPVLGTTGLKVDSVTCYGGSDGGITVKGTGATGRYVFTLQRNGNTVASNTDGLFANLPAATYTLITSRPADESCNDTYVQSITVHQRDPLQVITLAPVPITCNGKDDGSVRVQAGGGSGSYAYYWEYWDGSAWQHNPFWFATDVQISQLTPGRYRVTVSDTRSQGNCALVSTEVTIEEPALLRIADVRATDAACKADGGRIRITAAGGNGGYLYYYSLSDRLHYTLFTEDTPLTQTGDYYLKVVDAKGCSVESAGSYSINLPATPMSFTLQASDHEGWSVGCYQGNDGSITVSATGGSGSGYAYQLNNGAFQSSPVFEQLTAGAYTITVQDARGCVLSAPVTLTQPAVPLQGMITDKQEVNCPGTATGSFRIAVQNGRAPYEYSIDGGLHFQAGNAFTGLHTGTYAVVVKDKFNCTWSTSVTLVSLITPVQFVHTINNVSCFQGNDGGVTVTASAGKPPYLYQWEQPASANPQLTGLKAGRYVLLVTDAAGCLNPDTVMIAEPAAALTATTQAQPVCVGSKGHITVTASGGTPPYRYSAGNNAFQDNPVLGNLNAGTYTVVVRDKNNCEASYPVVINPANAMPEVNFLVASGKNALDTLVIREISLPAPDSVQWSFDPVAQVLESGQAPRIRFNQAGNYWVSMTGWFKGCAYTLRKTLYIQPYDPDAGLVYTPPVQVIDTAILYPNPNDGRFTVKVKMNRKQKLLLVIQEIGTGREAIRRSYSPSLITEDQFSLGSVAPGSYVLRVITENDSRDVLFVINR